MIADHSRQLRFRSDSRFLAEVAIPTEIRDDRFALMLQVFPLSLNIAYTSWGEDGLPAIEL